MSQNEQTYWKIHDFLKDRLEGDELRNFQKEIETNSSLSEEVEMHRITNKLIINNRLSAAKQTSLNIQKAEKQAELYKKIVIGATIAILTFASIYLIFNKKHPSKTQVTTQNVIGNTENTSIKTNEITTQKVEVSLEKSQTIKEEKRQNIITKSSLNKIEEQVNTPNSNEVFFNKDQVAGEQPKSTLVTIENNSTKKEIEDVCLKSKITANSFASTTCQNESEGSISVSDFRGGKAPYKFVITSAQSGKVFKNNHLAGGKYSISITDDNQCSTIIENIVVKEVNCSSEEIAFNPFLGESFQLDAYSKAGIFVVHERTGAIIYKKEVEAEEKIDWNGMSQNGEQETGHFAYEIVYEDGTRKNGSITITR